MKFYAIYLIYTERYAIDGVRDNLFQPPGLTFGIDLAALNIQRGRDHALPSYTRFREYCCLPNVRRFQDLAPLMSGSAVQSLRKVYKYAQLSATTASSLKLESLLEILLKPQIFVRKRTTPV